MGQSNSKTARAFIRLGVSLAALAAGAGAGAAYAQGTAPQNGTANANSNSNDVVIVTGYRKSVQAALTMKRNSEVMLDAINADDIASFPDPEGPTFVVADKGKAYVLLTASSPLGTVGEIVRVEKNVAGRTSVIKNLEDPTGLVASGAFVFVAENRPLGKGSIQKVPIP